MPIATTSPSLAGALGRRSRCRGVRCGPYTHTIRSGPPGTIGLRMTCLVQYRAFSASMRGRRALLLALILGFVVVTMIITMLIASAPSAIQPHITEAPPAGPGPAW